MGALKGYWGSRTAQDVIYQIGFDFVAQLEEIMASEQMDRAELAEKLGVSKGRVSQILNDPGNLTLKNVVKYSEVLGRKVTIVTYDDKPTPHENGPVSPQVFVACWKRAGRPKDLFEAGIVAASTSEVEIGAKWVDRIASDPIEDDADTRRHIDLAMFSRLNRRRGEDHAGTYAT